MKPFITPEISLGLRLGRQDSPLKKKFIGMKPSAANGFQSGRKYIINDAHLMTISYERHKARW